MSTNGSNGNGTGNGKSTEGRSQRKPKGRPAKTRGVAEVPDAISMLELDHRKIESLFAAYADAGPRDLEHKWQGW